MLHSSITGFQSAVTEPEFFSSVCWICLLWYKGIYPRTVKSFRRLQAPADTIYIHIYQDPFPGRVPFCILEICYRLRNTYIIYTILARCLTQCLPLPFRFNGENEQPAIDAAIRSLPVFTTEHRRRSLVDDVSVLV